MNSSLLEELQSKFKCSKCGKCCSVGGDMRLTLDDEDELFAFGYLDETSELNLLDLHDIPFHSYYTLKITHPCFFLDKLTRECRVHSHKPMACRDYPFKLYSQGGCNLDAVLTCPIAVKMLEDHLKGVEQMRSYTLCSRHGRYLGVIFPELFKMCIGFWLLYFIFDWSQSPYRYVDEKQLNIMIVWDP